jgi:RND family efflux transporter MFP subunit
VSRTRRRALRTISALLGVGALVACGRGDAADEAASATTIAVTVQPARIDSLRETVVVPGLIVPSAAAEQVVTSPEPAEVVEIPKAEGEAVQHGDLLARFEIASITAEIQARQLEVVEATSRFETARADATRLTSLHERGIVSRNALEASKSSFTAAETALAQAKTRLDATKTAQERTTARARFAGIVAKVFHKPGEMVAGGTTDPVLRVVDSTRLQISAQVPLAQFERVQPGQPAAVQAAAGLAGTATVALRHAPSPGATTGEVRLGLGTVATLPLDTPVQVELLLDERRDVIVVPVQALQKDATTSFVWIAGDDRQAHRRDVRVGLTVGGLSQIVSGITAGERVILTGIAELTEGTPITFR